MKSKQKNNPPAVEYLSQPQKSERIAKRMARAGLCSRRDAERWIEAGRVMLNGKKLASPAITVTDKDKIEVDGNALPGKERTRLWLFNKSSGVVTTNRDPEGRKTVFEILPDDIPRVMSVGRLDITTEGLLLLTNDGGLARVLELPSTGWLRRYKVRAHGKVSQQQLDGLKDGIAVDGVLYGSIDATLDKKQGHNCWLTLAFREGKNREVKKVLATLGLEVNRLIRLSYGPFQLSDLPSGKVREIRGRTLRDQLGERLIEQSGADFDAPLASQTQTNKAGQTKSPESKKAGSQARKKKTSKGRAELLSRLDTKPQKEQSDRNGKGGDGKNRPSGRKNGRYKKTDRNTKSAYADRRR